MTDPTGPKDHDVTEMTTFDLCGPLPEGTTVLEASAGTGKTHAITALAVRYIAEGHFRIDQIMMVTFSRAATGELRHRVHARLRNTRAALETWLAERTPPAEDVDLFLTRAPDEQVRARLGNVEEALASIDSATIATTHEFCQRMISSLGLLVDHDHTARFVDDEDDLATQVIHDVYLAHEVNGSATPPGRLATFARFAAVGRAALRESAADLVPVEPRGLSAERVAFAQAVRREFDVRKRRSGIYTFDDMVHRLRDALVVLPTRELARAALAERYPLVMIDEFQDTDPVQWEIVESAFVGRSTVVLIGDPKQAIYAFRGADVYSYLDAVEGATDVRTLSVNHRSDAAVVNGVLELFSGSTLGSPRILVRPVTARCTRARIRGPQADPAVQVRCLEAPGRHGFSSPTAARAVDADLVDQVVGMLRDGWQVDDGGGWRDLRPRDIAVLVRSNWRGEQIQSALDAAGVSAVFGGASTVMASEAAQSWLDLLRALVEPSAQAMKRAALGPLVGWDEVGLAASVDERPGARSLATLAVLVKTLGRILESQGIAAVHEALADHTDLSRRLLSRSDGERIMTDVRHVAQLLNDAAVRNQLGPAALTAWLEERIAEARGSRSDDRTRRLETDSSCVQVMTIHGAKGLEFPVVLLPEAAHEAPREPRQGDPSVLQLDGRRVLDVGIDAEWQGRQAIRQQQERAESLRTLYVASTRAKSRLVLWWAPTRAHTQGSALHRLLRGPRTAGSEPESAYELPEDPLSVVGLDTSLVALVRAGSGGTGRLEIPPTAMPTLVARPFTRAIDTTWRRTSYSGLTQEVHGHSTLPSTAAEADDMPPDEVELDEAGLDEAGLEEANQGNLAPDRADGPQRPAGPASALAELPGGTQFGTLVHAVLEAVDVTSDTLHQDLTDLVAHHSARQTLTGLDPEALVRGLEQVLETPLGRIADGLSLGQIPPADRLAELDFELPMGAPHTDGTHRSGRQRAHATLGSLADALSDPVLTGGDAFAARYGRHLAQSPVAEKTLNGFLTGSIDAVLRTGGNDQRFWVVDYKTNRIPVPEGVPLSCEHYTPEPMARAMIEAHYPLQALLYSVALHRHLRLRLPEYTPARHLGGIGYLFVRGMAGKATPVVDQTPCGVFTWLPSAALVEHCSELMGSTR